MQATLYPLASVGGSTCSNMDCKQARLSPMLQLGHVKVGCCLKHEQTWARNATTETSTRNDSAQRRCRICVVQEETVRDYWSYCGEIADLNLMRFPDSGRFRGIAFITFATVRCLALSAALLLFPQAAR